MARPKSQNRSIHTAIRLPPHIHKEIAEMAEETTMATEIKRRLEFSLRLDRLEGHSHFIIKQMVEFMDLMQATGAPWQSSPYLRDVLAQAMVQLLRVYAPGEPGELQTVPRDAEAWLKADTPPEHAAESLVQFQMTLSALKKRDQMIPEVHAPRAKRKAKKN